MATGWDAEGARLLWQIQRKRAWECDYRLGAMMKGMPHMTYSAIILLLVLNLLCCPLCCVGWEACEGSSQPAACGCCGCGESKALPETPPASERDCDCQSCICEGALVPIDYQCPSTSKVIDWTSPFCDGSSPMNHGKGFDSRTAPTGCFARCSASYQRAVLQSWQI